MSIRSKIIIVLLCISAAAAIVVPSVLAFFGGFVISQSWFLDVLFSLYVFPTVALFWVGMPAGWRFVSDNFAPGEKTAIAAVICALIGIYLSLPIAIVQVLRDR